MEELISKKKLIADLKGIKDMLAAAGDPFLASVINKAIGCAENQPVANAAEVNRGQWVLKSAGQWTSVCECSECHGKITVCCDIEYAASRAARENPFCSKCGSRMNGGVPNV